MMDTLSERCRQAFANSRKLQGLSPTDDQLNNVVARLQQIFTETELEQMDSWSLIRQVERVWPIARYVDRNN